MSEHVKWLRQQLKKAEGELERITHEVRMLDVEYGDVQNRFRVWSEALQVAQEEAGKTSEPVQLELPPHRRKATIADLTKEILQEVGPLDSGELAERLAQKGKRTSRNTVTVTLNRFRPGTFDRNKEGKWFLTEHEGETE